MIMKSEWERIEMNGNVIGCDIGVGFDSISAIQHWNENKWMNEWMNEWVILQTSIWIESILWLCIFCTIRMNDGLLTRKYR